MAAAPDVGDDVHEPDVAVVEDVDGLSVRSPDTLLGMVLLAALLR